MGISFARASAVAVGVGVLGLASSRSSAQLVVGSTTTTTTNPCAVYIDITTGVQTTLWNSAANKKVNGAATDPVGRRLYTNDAARLNFWDFGNIGVTPTFIAGMYRTNDNVTFTATGVDGLAWANGKLYASTSFGSTVYDRGIYEVTTVSDGASPTPHCVMTPKWLDPTGVGTSSGTVVFSGLDFNDADGLFYTTQTVDAVAAGGTMTRGLWSVDVFGSGAVNKIADFPAGRTNIDGLAIGGGKFWLTEMITGTGLAIYPYNPATSSYETTITVSFTDATQRAAGATWAPGALPEPGAIGAIAAAVIARGMARRRR